MHIWGVMRIVRKINLFCVLLVASQANAKELAPLFATNVPLEVTIEAPLTTLMTERPDEEYLEGTFSYTGADGTVQDLDLKIRTRGNFRRMETTCDFAPIRLNFKKKQVKDTEFDGQDKLKLVTHCQNNVPYNEQLVMREYLAYRIFQVLTDKSFSVRLLHINYVDNEGADPMTKYGFVIEDNDDVAKRVDMKSLNNGDITHAELDPQQENLVNIFQFMIGNTDYSLIKGVPGEECCHNSELLSATGDAPYTPLPYDFDFAGLVNASYAQVNPQFNLRSVRQRLYRGICPNNELVPDTVQHFLDNREAIYAIIDEMTMLSRRSRGDVTNYLDGFFKNISTAKSVNSRFIARCNETVESLNEQIQ